jgi:cell division protein FtsZ
LHEVSTAADTIYEVVDSNANIIFGAVIDEKKQGEIQITVIATGFSSEPEVVPAPPASKATTSRTPAPTTPPKETKSAPPATETKRNNPVLDIPDFLQRRRPGGR